MDSPEVIERAMALGASDYIVKTQYPISAIVEKINVMLGSHTSWRNR